MRQASAALTALLNGQRKALQFDGSTQSVSVTDTASLHLGIVSVECWVKPIALPTNGVIVSKWDQGSAQRSWALVYGALGAVGMYSSSTGADFTQAVGSSAGAVAIGQSTHIVAVYNGTSETLFINGAPAGSGTGLGPYSPSTSPVRMAVDGNGGLGSKWNGLIDEFRLYGRALSATEALEHYNGIYRDESGLVLWLPVDEGGGSTAFDLSGKGNNGTLVLAPAYVDFNPNQGTERQFRIADLLTITLVNGAALRYTSADFDITSGGNLFSSKGPLFKRSKTKMVVGITVDEMELSIFPTSSDLISGQPFMQAVKLGVFDGATVTVERAFMPAWGNVSAGTLVMFSGRMGPADSTRSEARFKVNSDLELLNIPMPRNIYQPGCMKTVYDAACTLVKANYVVRGVVTSGTASVVNASAVTTASGEFDLGTIEFEAAASLPGTAGNYVSTPDTVANSVTGDLDVRIKLSLNSSAGTYGLVVKRDGSGTQYSWQFIFVAGGTVQFNFTQDGSTQISAAASSASPFPIGATGWLRVTRVSSTGDVAYFSSADGITWSALGTATTTAGAMFDSISPVELGSTRGGGLNNLPGNLYYAEIRNGIAGTVIAKFDPTNDTPQGANLLSSTGELWSMNGLAALVGMTNRGQRRTVKSYTPGVFTLIRPLPNVPVAGDLFAAYPGCDKQQSTCGVNVGITYTADSTTDTLTATAHGLVNDKAVKLSTTGTFPGAAIALDAVTAYFVVNATANTFQLARNIGGVAIDITSNGTGTNKIAQAGKFANLAHFRGTPRVPVPETMI